MEKYSAEWWVHNDKEFIEQMPIGVFRNAPFGGEYRVVEEDEARYVEVFGPDNSYEKVKIE